MNTVNIDLVPAEVEVGIEIDELSGGTTAFRLSDAIRFISSIRSLGPASRDALHDYIRSNINTLQNMYDEDEISGRPGEYFYYFWGANKPRGGLFTADNAAQKIGGVSATAQRNAAIARLNYQGQWGPHSLSDTILALQVPWEGETEVARTNAAGFLRTIGVDSVFDSEDKKDFDMYVSMLGTIRPCFADFSTATFKKEKLKSILLSTAFLELADSWRKGDYTPFQFCDATPRTQYGSPAAAAAAVPATLAQQIIDSGAAAAAPVAAAAAAAVEPVAAAAAVAVEPAAAAVAQPVEAATSLLAQPVAVAAEVASAATSAVAAAAQPVQATFAEAFRRRSLGVKPRGSGIPRLSLPPSRSESPGSTSLVSRQQAEQIEEVAQRARELEAALAESRRQAAAVAAETRLDRTASDLVTQTLASATAEQAAESARAVAAAQQAAAQLAAAAEQAAAAERATAAAAQAQNAQLAVQEQRAALQGNAYAVELANHVDAFTDALAATPQNVLAIFQNPSSLIDTIDRLLREQEQNAQFMYVQTQIQLLSLLSIIVNALDIVKIVYLYFNRIANAVISSRTATFQRDLDSDTVVRNAILGLVAWMFVTLIRKLVQSIPRSRSATSTALVTAPINTQALENILGQQVANTLVRRALSGNRNLTETEFSQVRRQLQGISFARFNVRPNRADLIALFNTISRSLPPFTQGALSELVATAGSGISSVPAIEDLQSAEQIALELLPVATSPQSPFLSSPAPALRASPAQASPAQAELAEAFQRVETALSGSASVSGLQASPQSFSSPAVDAYLASPIPISTPNSVATPARAQEVLVSILNASPTASPRPAPLSPFLSSSSTASPSRTLDALLSGSPSAELARKTFVSAPLSAASPTSPRRPTLSPPPIPRGASLSIADLGTPEAFRGQSLAEIRAALDQAVPTPPVSQLPQTAPRSVAERVEHPAPKLDEALGDEANAFLRTLTTKELALFEGIRNYYGHGRVQTTTRTPRDIKEFELISSRYASEQQSLSDKMDKWRLKKGYTITRFFQSKPFQKAYVLSNILYPNNDKPWQWSRAEFARLNL